MYFFAKQVFPQKLKLKKRKNLLQKEQENTGSNEKHRQ